MGDGEIRMGGVKGLRRVCGLFLNNRLWEGLTLDVGLPVH